MMQKNRTAQKIYTPIFIIATVAVVIMRTIACLNHLDFTSNFFNSKALITVSNYMTVAFALILFTYAIFAPKRQKLAADFSASSVYIPSGAVCVALIFLAIYMYSASKITGNAMVSNLQFAIFVLSALSLLHFIMNAFITERLHIVRGYFGICTVLLLALYASYLYFNTDLPINAPNKIVDQMALLFSALFFLYETRISLNRDKWRMYLATGYISAMLCAYSSIPALITYFAKDIVISNNIYENIFVLTIGLFISLRIISTIRLLEDKNCELVEALDELAKAKASELAKSVDTLLPADEATADSESSDSLEEQNTATEGDDESADDSEQEPAVLIPLETFPEELTAPATQEENTASEEINEKDTGN